MPPGREKDNVPHEDETEDSPVPVRVHEENATEQPDLNKKSVKTGGGIARWFKLREPPAPTKPSDPVETIPSVSRLRETAESQYDDERGDEESSLLGSTAASSSKPKTKDKTRPQNVVEKPKRRRSASDHSSESRKVRQPRTRRRSSTSKSSRRSSKEIPESNSERGELRLILETQEENESVEKLEGEMSEKLEEVREIKKLQSKDKVENETASGTTLSRNDDKEEEERQFTENAKSELEEEMKAKAADTRTHTENMRMKLKSDYDNQAKALTQEYEKKLQVELKLALAAAKNKVRKEAAEETLRFEAFIRTQVTHDCEKIDEECDQRIKAINHERKERQLAVRQKGQEAIETRRNTSEMTEQVDEREQSAYSMLELSEKERLQKHKDAIEAEQKLDMTRTILEEQSRQKLQKYSAEIEQQANDRIKPKKDAHTEGGENNKSPEIWASQTMPSDDSNRPQRSLIEEELLLREAKKSQKGPDSHAAPVLKTSLKTSSPAKVGKKVLFENSQEEGKEESCSCIKQGHFACIPFVDSAVDLLKQARERPRGRSFAQSHSRESIFARVASNNVVYENSDEDPRNDTMSSASPK